MKGLLRLISAIVLAIALIGAVSAEMINGAGATFPYPLYSKWFYEYEKQTSVKINYQSIGSGGGIQQVKVGTIDFGASDSPLSKGDLDKNGLFQFPTVGGAVAVVYNLPGVKTGLKLTPEILADIYLGKITKWKDQRISAINPKLAFPDLPIIVVHRSDGSGTTNIFTWFLCDVSSEWNKAAGSGTSVKWPAGIGGKGNEGVSGLVRQTRGSIGYVELAYALQTGLSHASLRNKDGYYVNPELKTIQAAAANAPAPPDYFFVKFTYVSGKGAYPISGYTYLIVKKSLDKRKLSVIARFVEWAYKNGDKDAISLHYVPIPKSLKKRVLIALGKL